MLTNVGIILTKPLNNNFINTISLNKNTNNYKINTCIYYIPPCISTGYVHIITTLLKASEPWWLSLKSDKITLRSVSYVIMCKCRHKEKWLFNTGQILCHFKEDNPDKHDSNTQLHCKKDIDAFSQTTLQICKSQCLSMPPRTKT